MLFHSHFPLQKCHFHKFAISFLQASNYSGLVVFCIFFGISYGMVGALQFEVLMAIVGTEKFPSAIGLVLLVEAIAVLIGPPGAGQNRRTHKILKCSQMNLLLRDSQYLWHIFCYLVVFCPILGYLLKRITHKPPSPQIQGFNNGK